MTGWHEEQSHRSFLFFPLKHNTQDHNKFTLHKVQAYNILIVITVNTTEHGGWYYNENGKKMYKQLIFPDKWKMEKTAVVFLCLSSSPWKLECNIFRKMAKEQTGLVNISLLHFNFIFHYTFYRLTKYWTHTSVPKHPFTWYVHTQIMSINIITAKNSFHLCQFKNLNSYKPSWLLPALMFIWTFWSKPVHGFQHHYNSLCSVSPCQGHLVNTGAFHTCLQLVSTLGNVKMWSIIQNIIRSKNFYFAFSYSKTLFPFQW